MSRWHRKIYPPSKEEDVEVTISLWEDMEIIMYIHVKFPRNYRAAGSSNKSYAEWPPSPYRFYCALINAYYRHFRATGSELYRGLLGALERLPPPIILTEVQVEKSAYSSYVKCDVLRSNSKPAINYKLLRSYPFTTANEVYFKWDGVDDKLQSLFPRIDYLGEADSLVEVSSSDPNGTFCIWEPCDNGSNQVRCPYDGLLKDLDLKYEGKKEMIYPISQSYTCRKARVHDGEIEKHVQAQVWEPMRYILGFEHGEYIPGIFQTPAVANTIRIALGKKAKELGLESFESEIFGKSNHKEKSHLAYVPLINVLGAYPSHDIKGMAICMPKDMVTFQDDLERCLFHLYGSEIPFWVDNRQYGNLRIVKPNGMKTLEADTWCKKSKVWVTATPVDFHFTKEADRKAEWTKECRRYGLPEPSEIISDRFSKTGHDAKSFIDVMHKSSNVGRKVGFLTNLEIHFPIAVNGPILLGRSKNFGMGIMYPVG